MTVEPQGEARKQTVSGLEIEMPFEERYALPVGKGRVWRFKIVPGFAGDLYTLLWNGNDPWSPFEGVGPGTLRPSPPKSN